MQMSFKLEMQRDIVCIRVKKIKQTIQIDKSTSDALLGKEKKVVILVILRRSLLTG